MSADVFHKAPPVNAQLAANFNSVPIIAETSPEVNGFSADFYLKTKAAEKRVHMPALFLCLLLRRNCGWKTRNCRCTNIADALWQHRTENE